jgi:hypothetical protein
MARDLIYGKTTRDWGLGASLLNLPPKQQVEQDIQAKLAVRTLPKIVEAETQAAFQLAARLSNEGKITAVERKDLKPILQKWFALRDKRRGKFLGEDYIELVNLRDAAQAYRKRLGEFAKRPSLASTPPDPHNVSPANGLIVPLLVAASATGLSLLIFSKNKI